MADDVDFSGAWHCTHWYPSNNHDGDDMSECEVVAQQKGTLVVFQSLPDEHGAYMLVRLRIDDDFARGTWTENTAVDGEYEGKLYSGSLEMIIDAYKRRIAGKWVGIGQDQVKNQPDVYVGRWELTRQ